MCRGWHHRRFSQQLSRDCFQAGKGTLADMNSWAVKHARAHTHRNTFSQSVTVAGSAPLHYPNTRCFPPSCLSSALPSAPSFLPERKWATSLFSNAVAVSIWVTSADQLARNVDTVLRLLFSSLHKNDSFFLSDTISLETRKKVKWFFFLSTH